MIVEKTGQDKVGSKAKYKDKDWEEFKDFFFRLDKDSYPYRLQLLVYPFRVLIGLLIWGALKVFEWLGGGR